MSEFTTPLHVEQVNDGTWRLLAPLCYVSDLLGIELEVPAGFETDFASVPRLPFAYMVAGGKATKEAVIHDYLYQTKYVPRAKADAVFREAMEAAGQPWWRRTLMWSGVRIFGWIPFGDDHDPDSDQPDHSPGA